MQKLIFGKKSLMDITKLYMVSLHEIEDGINRRIQYEELELPMRIFNANWPKIDARKKKLCSNIFS